MRHMLRTSRGRHDQAFLCPQRGRSTLSFDCDQFTGPIRCALRRLEPTKTEGLIAIDDASYFLSKIELTKGGAPSMPAWRQNLFIAKSKLSADSAESFCLPPDRTMIMGSRTGFDRLQDNGGPYQPRLQGTQRHVKTDAPPGAGTVSLRTTLAADRCHQSHRRRRLPTQRWNYSAQRSIGHPVRIPTDYLE